MNGRGIILPPVTQQIKQQQRVSGFGAQYLATNSRVVRKLLHNRPNPGVTRWNRVIWIWRWFSTPHHI